MAKELISFVETTVNSESSFLNHISQEIWKNPELKFEETFAHDLLVKVLKEKRFTVQEHYVMPTAFRAEFQSKVPGPTVVVICEYDALPRIGHACGHNLIAESGLGAGLAIKTAMEKNPNIPGKVVVLGTPAEEGGAGKITLLSAGAFEGVDAALMVHPGPLDHLYTPFIGVSRATVQFNGKEAHASGYPWDGVNALDAAVACYTNYSHLRQHIKPDCRIHAIITKGGDAPNVIPGHTELKVHCRSATTKDLENLNKKVAACAESAAIATGCTYKIIPDKEPAYESLMTNSVLAERYKKYAEHFGVKFCDSNPKAIPFMASSDMGNVSHVVPSIHPTYSIGTTAVNHSVGFTEASGAPEAQPATLITAKAMALLALDVLLDKEFLSEAKRRFQKDLKEDKGEE
ncbi:xaa-Arg dipeptidase-like [Uloborus diversus]|uniref:xaa-Arg dipeptidase-like n=1 Tax=Uloborus diversus TaxID=327109 RepID=UPI002409C854|nr:xaa-Arg dipeptidase-like [Uloborus diversus]